ncbi:MAG: patatin-like phospholipase family protein [Chitinophagales bacterium]|nr:patatin-like phospholipase family protein [Hyphomicrobiales bacterium]
MLLTITAAIAACSSLPRTQFTEAEQGMAEVPGMRDVRFWADAPKNEIERIIGKAALDQAARRQGGFTYLAMSGGASDGAYGAGVMNGWTRRGDRPEFTLVSGVSAGALIAPFAFLGPDYDKPLMLAFTTGIAESLGGDGGSLLSLLGQQDVQRETLYNLVASYVDELFMRRVAEEHAKGRRLLIVTVNLDAQRAVVWNMGAIAASRHPQSLKLFRDVLTASSSIPGVFAPTRIEVTAGGRTFSELHVDGGVITPVFTVPESFILAGGGVRASGPASRIFIVMNSRLSPEFEVVEAGILPLAGRSLSTLLKSQARLTLLTTLEFTRTNRFGFNLTYIDDGFPQDMKADFSAAYMSAVYEYGFRKGASEQLWQDTLGPRANRPLTPQP